MPREPIELPRIALSSSTLQTLGSSAAKRCRLLFIRPRLKIGHDSGPHHFGVFDKPVSAALIGAPCGPDVRSLRRCPTRARMALAPAAGVCRSPGIGPKLVRRCCARHPIMPRRHHRWRIELRQECNNRRELRRSCHPTWSFTGPHQQPGHGAIGIHRYSMLVSFNEEPASSKEVAPITVGQSPLGGKNSTPGPCW